MALLITGDGISGDRTRHTARQVPGHEHAWEVSWLPGQRLDRTAAITAMVLADAAGSGTPRPGDRLWLHVQGWAAEIGLTAPGALARVARPPGGTRAGKDEAAHADPEAGS